MIKRSKFLRVLAATLCGGMMFTAATGALAVYPDKPIRIVVPQPPGGASDIYARIIVQKMAKILGQSIIIDNRPGASGNIGTELVARSAADGYTLLLTPSATLTVNPSLYTKVPFNTFKDLMPITELVDLPMLLVVNPRLPVNTVKELIDYAKKQPGKLNYASAGSGQMVHLAMELLKTSANVKIEHVPYKGGSQALPDVISGQVEMMFLSIPATLPYVNAGQLKVLGVSSSKRTPAAPAVPTIAESGLPGFSASLWLGLFAPSGTPPEVISRLHAASVQALQDPEIRQKMDADGTVVVGSSPRDVTRVMEAESDKWSKVIREIGLKLD